MKRMISFFARQHLFVNLFTLAIIGYGAYVTVNTNVETFPSVDYDIVIVTSVFPGASSIDVEKLITIPIEDSLKSISGIKETDSYSVENSSIIVMTLDANSADKNKTIRDIERAVDNVKDLPTEIEKPVVTELNTREVPIIAYSISGGENFEELRKFAKILSDRLSNVDGVSEVTRSGYKEKEIHVNVDPEKIRDYYLSIAEIIAAIKSSNISLPGGKILDPLDEIMIRTNNEFKSVNDVKKTVVRSNTQGQAVFVSDIAEVVDSYEEESIFYRADGSQAIVLSCVKKEKYDTINLVAALEKQIKSFNREFSNKFKIKTFNDMSYYTKRRLNVLLNNGVIGLIGILLCMIIFLNPITAFVGSIGIPFSIFATFMLFNNFGLTINLISMVGFIMVLGMLVDDAVVVAENITYYLERGKSAIDAAITGCSEVFVPVLGSILTTILAFFPLMFLDGIMGKFIWAIPFVIIITLSMSLLESVFILPAHLSFGGRLVKPRQNRLIKPVERFYRRVLEFNLEHKKIVLATLLVLTLFTGWIARSKIRIILFPGGAIKMFAVQFKLPVGSSLQLTSEKASEIEKIIDKIDNNLIDCYITKIGTTALDKFDPKGKDGSEYGVIIVYLPPESTEKEALQNIKESIRTDLKLLSGFDNISLEDFHTGPPQGRAVEVAIKGDDFNVLNEISEKIKDYLKTINGVIDIDTNFMKGKNEIEVKVDRKLAAIHSVEPSVLATSVRSAFEGVIATKIKGAEEEIAIRVIYPEKFRRSAENLRNLQIINKFGKLITLSNVASFSNAESIRSIRHKKNIRTIIVSADVDTQITTSYEVNKIIQSRFKDISSEYPGYVLDFEGEFKDTKESFDSIYKALTQAVILVYISIAVTSGSLILPFLIMLSIPFGLIGIILAFFIHNEPISFLSMIGTVGMAGVVVNNSIVLGNIISRNIKEGMEIKEAIIEGSVRRLRAILLTTVTTLIGLFPTAYGLGGSEEFVQPMVLALAWGLVFSAILTLCLFPVNYYISEIIKKYSISKFFYKFILICFFTLIGSLNNSYAKEVSEPIGQNRLSIEAFIEKAVIRNFDFKVIQENKDIIKHSWQGQVLGVYDPRLSLSSGYFIDSGKQDSDFFPRNLKVKSFDFSLNKKFLQGTYVSIGSKFSFNSFEYGPLSDQNEYYSNKISIAINQPLLKNTFGRADRILIMSFKEEEKSSLLSLQESVDEFILQAIGLYYSWVLDNLNFETKKQSLEFSNMLLNENTKKYRQGLIENRDLVKIKLLHQQRKNEVLMAANSLKKSERLLGQFIDDNNEFNADQDLLVPKIEGFGEILHDQANEIINNTPSYQALKRKHEKIALQIDLENLEKRPEVNFVLNYDISGKDSSKSVAIRDSLNTEKYPSYYVGLSLSHTFVGTARENNYKKYSAEKRIIQYNLLKKRAEIFNNIKNSYEELLTNHNKMENYKNINELQGQKLELEQKAFRGGRSEINDIINYENELMLSSLMLCQSKIEYILSYYRHLKEINKLIEKFNFISL